MLTKLLLAIALGTLGTIPAAKAPTAVSVVPSAGKVVTLDWGRLIWHIPERFFFGIRTWSENQNENSKELWIQFGWSKNLNNFRPPDMKGYDTMLDVHVRKVDSEDPRSGLQLIHRIHLPFTKVPIFSSATFNGMTYLGSSSSIHYFALRNEDAYVDCWLVKADRLMPPKVAPDVLSKKFTCGTVFILPRQTYVWVRIWGVDLNEASPAFNAAHRLLLSFIGHQDVAP